MFNNFFFFENGAVYENVGKYGRAIEATDGSMMRPRKDAISHDGYLRQESKCTLTVLILAVS
jgi:hypothetical protein